MGPKMLVKTFVRLTLDGPLLVRQNLYNQRQTRNSVHQPHTLLCDAPDLAVSATVTDVTVHKSTMSATHDDGLDINCPVCLV